MPIVTKTYTFSAGALVVAAQLNTNFDTLYNLVNGQIDSQNLSASATAFTDNTFDGGDSDPTFIGGFDMDGGQANTVYSQTQYVTGGTA